MIGEHKPLTIHILIISKWEIWITFLYPDGDPDLCQNLMGSKMDQDPLSDFFHEITVNFQNNAQVQINAWFKLTPGTKHTVYNLLHCFLYFKRTPGAI